MVANVIIAVRLRMVVHACVRTAPSHHHRASAQDAETIQNGGFLCIARHLLLSWSLRRSRQVTCSAKGISLNPTLIDAIGVLSLKDRLSDHLEAHRGAKLDKMHRGRGSEHRVR